MVALIFLLLSNCLVFADDNKKSDIDLNTKEIIRLLTNADKAKYTLKVSYSDSTIRFDGNLYANLNGEHSRFDKAMGVLGVYFSNAAAEIELKKIGIRNVNNRLIGVLSDVEGGYRINRNSKYDFLYINSKKLFIKILMEGEYGDRDNFFYTLRKVDNRWIIDDEVDEDKIHNMDDNWVAIRSSSCLLEKGIMYEPKYAIDNDITTAWVEGVKGSGIGEWIDFAFAKEEKIKAINIINGYAKSNKHYCVNNRVKKVKIQFNDGASMVQELKDAVLEPQRIELPEEKTVYSVRMTILEVYPGAKYNDTCISEVEFE
jgi:hypothetical protein